MTDDTDLIDRIAKEHDLTRQEAREVVDDVQSDAGVALACSECGATTDPAMVSRPTADVVVAARDPRDGERRALCDSCLSAALESHTLLSPQQARILPLMLANWRTTEIADVVDTQPDNVSVQKSKIRNRITEAYEQLDEAEATLIALGDLIEEDEER